MNEGSWAVHTGLCGLLDSVQDVCDRMYNNEEIIAQQKEELSSTVDIYKNIRDHQKQYTGLPNIKYFTPLELKKMK